MNQLNNLNAKLIKEVVYDSTLQSSATTLNFTVENCSGDPKENVWVFIVAEIAFLLFFKRKYWGVFPEIW